MASLRSIAQTLLYFQSLATCITASHVPGAPLGAAGLSLGARNSGKIAPKVFILDAFTPEAESFYAAIPHLLDQNITVPGLSPRFPKAHCKHSGDVCQVTTGEGEINAASSIAALLYSGVFDLTHTYFLIAGIAGVNPARATTGSVTFARFEVQVALQYEFDIRDIGNNFSTGYIPYGTHEPNEYPTLIYGTEVFEVNDALRQKAITFAKTAKLNDTKAAQEYRSQFPHAPANQKPSIVACDGATSDVFYHGPTLGNAFDKFTTVITNGTGHYCATAQEDSAMLEAFLRGAKAGLVDFGRIIVMRTAANFDRPPPDLSPYIEFFYRFSGGFGPSLANLALAGVPIIDGIVKGWSKEYQAGIKATNYIGDIFGTLGGVPDFGPYPNFGEG